MRKVTVTVTNTFFTKIGLRNTFKHLESLNMIDFIRLDSRRLTEIVVLELHRKPGTTLEDVQLPKYMEVMHIFHEDDEKTFCMLKATYPKTFRPFFDAIDLDVIWTNPCKIYKDHSVFSCVGTEENLKKFIRGIRFFGKIEQVSYTKPDYKGHNELEALTARQRDIVRAAHEHGYYAYPRKIDATALATLLKCSKPTLIEHLRKAENTLINGILERYE